MSNSEKEIKKQLIKYDGNEAVKFYEIMSKEHGQEYPVCVINERFMGMCDDNFVFEYLYVFPEHRNKSIATTLFKNGNIANPSKDMIHIAFTKGLLKHYEGDYYYNDNYPDYLFNIKYGFYIKKINTILFPIILANCNKWFSKGFTFQETLIPAMSLDEGMIVMESEQGNEFKKACEEIK